MSWRIWQPPATRASIAAHTPMRIREALIIMHLGNVLSREPLEKTGGLREIELLVARLNADEEAVLGSMAETIRIENRVMRLRQLVEGEHAEDGGQRSAKNGQLKRDGNEGRPAIERAAGDIQR